MVLPSSTSCCSPVLCLVFQSTTFECVCVVMVGGVKAMKMLMGSPVELLVGSTNTHTQNRYIKLFILHQLSTSINIFSFLRGMSALWGSS